MLKSDIKKGMKVYDSWWPIRLGKVTRVCKRSVWVVWNDGERVIYDLPHCKFLRNLAK